MRFPLQDNVAVVTGAASGIGAALAQALAARGCHLALADRNADGLEAVAARVRTGGVSVSTHPLDIADADAVASLPAAVLAAHGRAGVLVNNAGVALGGTFAQVSEADFAWLFEINFWGTVRMTRALMPVLRRAPVAQIVNVSSIYGIIAPPGQTAYSASKFAVRGFSEALRHEMEAEGGKIGVTVVHPGGVRTSIVANARMSAVTEAQRASGMKAAERLLRLSPEAAAARILQGIERREKRVLVGSDAKQVALIQRLMPVGYWSLLARRAGGGRPRSADTAANATPAPAKK